MKSDIADYNDIGLAVGEILQYKQKHRETYSVSRLTLNDVLFHLTDTRTSNRCRKDVTLIIGECLFLKPQRHRKSRREGRVNVLKIIQIYSFSHSLD